MKPLILLCIAAFSLSSQIFAQDEPADTTDVFAIPLDTSAREERQIQKRMKKIEKEFKEESE